MNGALAMKYTCRFASAPEGHIPAKGHFWRTIFTLFDVVLSTGWLDTMSTTVCALLGCQKIMKMFTFNFSHKSVGKQTTCLFFRLGHENYLNQFVFLD